MREAKIFTSDKSINRLLLAVATLCFLLPAYAEESLPAKSADSNNSELATSTPADSSSDQAKPSELKLPEVKNDATALQGKADSKTEKKSSAPNKAKKTKKTALEQMSSDDTTAAYSLSIDPNAHFEKARQLAAHQKYNAALKEVNEALTQNPQFYEALYLGALIYDKQGRKQEAAKKYKHLLLYKPNYLQARISFAMVLSDLGQTQAAEAEYRKALELSYTSFEAHYDLANLLTKQSRFKEALQELRICLKLEPDSAATHNNLGVIYFHQHYVEESEKEFEQASELDPANKTYLHNLDLVRSGNQSLEAPSLG